ncbi:uncharacterized protein [Drosophila pseudoobscura]|uniref:Uncharacterized protein n=1 Tax=Drosophila pseudoobscura pseudoobscura TaxID=46245 RepID=A0A6I8W6Q5_DROPS|nr:uncharacterized protein LOC117184618 [Drosophila pseudoobscura]
MSQRAYSTSGSRIPQWTGKRTISSRYRTFCLFFLCASGLPYRPPLARPPSACPLDASGKFFSRFAALRRLHSSLPDAPPFLGRQYSARNTSCRSVDTNSRYRTPPSLTRRFTLLEVGFIRARERVTTAGHSSRLPGRHRALSADLVWGHDAWRWSSGRRASARSPGHDACRPSFGRSPWLGSGHCHGPLSHGSGLATCCLASLESARPWVPIQGADRSSSP